MFDHPGYKLKTTAKVLFWLGLVGSVILAFVYSFAIVIYGFIYSFISSLVLFGFGEVIDELNAIRIGITDLKVKENTSSQNSIKTAIEASLPQGSASTGNFNLNDYI